jgi:hypothetical protein
LGGAIQLVWFVFCSAGFLGLRHTEDQIGSDRIRIQIQGEGTSDEPAARGKFKKRKKRIFV